MIPNDFENLLGVQELDTQLDQIEHRLATLPEAEEVARVRSRLAALDERRAELDRERGEPLRNQRRLEDELTALGDKIADVDRTLYSGSVVAHRELEALQADLDSLKRRRSHLEDEVLELMELLEPFAGQVAEQVAERETLTAELDRAEALLTVARAEAEVERDALRHRRNEAAEPVPTELLGLYEQLRKRLDGIGAARFTGNRCEGCHLTLPAGEADEVRRESRDAVVHCPECSRILVREARG